MSKHTSCIVHSCHRGPPWVHLSGYGCDKLQSSAVRTRCVQDASSLTHLFLQSIECLWSTRSKRSKSIQTFIVRPKAGWVKGYAVFGILINNRSIATP